MTLRLAVCFLSLLCAADAQQAQKPGKEEPKTASVEGIVVNALTKEPIRRAEISVMARKPGQQMGAGPAGSAVTDAEGKFRVAELEEGSYLITIRRTGFVSPRGGSLSSALNLQLKAGQELKGLKYALTPQAVISGRVLDDEGEPVQNANVMSMIQRSVRGKRLWMPSGPGAQTNDKGEFRLTNVPAGKYVLTVQLWQPPAAVEGRPGQAAMGYVTSYYPGVTDIAQATPVETTAGSESSGFDVPLKKVPVFKIRGRALNAEGQPIKDFFAAVVPREQLSYGATGRMIQRREDGSFEIANVPSGSWVVQVGTGRGGPMSSTEQQSASTTVEVNGQDVDGVEVRVRPPATIQGNVLIEAAPEEQKNILSTFMVSLVPDGPSFTMGNQPSRVQPDGSFAIKSNTSGRYLFNAYSSSATALYLASVRVGNQEYFGKPVDLSAGAAGPVKIIFRGDGGRITGSIELPSEDKSTGNTLVVLVPADPELRDSFMGRSAHPVDQNGGFSFDNVRPGEYYVAAASGAQYNVTEEVEQEKEFESKAVKVRVTAGGSSTVQLKPIVVAER